MNLSFEKVFKNEDEKLKEIYEIIRASGEHMLKHQGLAHWKTPYPIKSIKKNCEEKNVFLVKDLDTNLYVHTFQLEFKCSMKNNNEEHEAVLNKFATIPQAAGKGIGKKSLIYIEDYCRNNGASIINLDVYDQSKHAIQFYKKRGFVVTSSKPTRNFTVYIMEKQL
ncbi:GNAT family N-acetyltransferase [Lentibacillus sediminis]|uniref:GNAT family N-acetyltransferase n=1 Tax=Lentibacillus sediminis TaxID=1940529 RepID=UPI0013043344|nr:GNAT family N-acetyltransferase [Lentibacillus sediminis]